MLDKLIEWFISVINDVLPCFIVKEYEEAVLLRGGKFKKICKKGFHWKIPFYDEYVNHHTIVTTMNLSAQSLVTKDDKSIVVKAVVKYKIVDVKVFLLEVYDSTDAISDVTQGIIKNIIMSSTWEQCRDDKIDNEITKKVRNELKKFGVYIENITLTDLGPMKSFRLFNENEIIKND